uniref:Trigger factor n=1 Tax=Eubacterium cellulosolvens (strain ATCC 43171 / JCM 9499 / 6) TaxID=633697 RepID=I5ASS7_EUBC6
MSVKVENLENSMAKLTIEVSAEEFEKELQNAYQKQKKNISIPGFRKGKVPRAMVEKMYGPAVFYDDAANALIPKAYVDAEKESGLDIVSRPAIDVVQIEKGKAFIFTAEVATKPEVTLGDYKGVEVPKTDTTVTDEDVQKRLEQEQRKNSREITREAEDAAQDGDTLTLDFEGKIDGVAFDGGTASNQTLKLGSNSFIPGFEAQLVGVKTGETKDITVTFPEDYHAEELKGKEAVFTCTVHKITATELPELDDEFAGDVSEFDTLDEFKADLKKQLQEEKDRAAKQAKRDNGLTKAAANATIEIPQAMMDTRCDDMVENFARRLQSQGMSLDQYMQYTGSDMNAMRAQVKPQAEIQIRNELVLEKIAEVENITVTDDDVKGEMETMAKAYNMKLEDIEKMIGDEQKEIIKKDLALQKAADLIADNAVEVEAQAEEKKEEE